MMSTIKNKIMGLRSVFIPDRIGSYYLFSQIIVSCELTKSEVKCAVVKAHGTKRSIEQVIQTPLLNDVELPYSERVSNVLAHVFANIKHYDTVKIIIPVGLVIFKELSLPFVDPEKIKLILPFEIESLLPFPLNQAALDCVVIPKDSNSSYVMAAAVKNDILNDQSALFKSANISIDSATVDMFELVAAYKAISDNKDCNCIILYMGLHSTRLAIVTQGAIRFMRFLPYGIGKFSKLLHIEPSYLLHSGYEYNQEHAQQLTSFFDDIHLTIESFIQKNSSVVSGQTSKKMLERIILAGLVVDIKNVSAAFEHALGLSCTLLTTTLLLQKDSASIKGSNGKALSNNAIIPICSALLFPMTLDFNLYMHHVQERKESQINTQLITAAILILLTLGSMLTFTLLNQLTLKREIESSESEVINTLKQTFPALAKRPGSSSLDSLKNAARTLVAREKNIWFALSPQNRASFLVYLQEISTRIDPDGLGLILTRMTLTEETLTLEGQVKDFPALARLEEDLRQSKMFSFVPRLEELKFSAKIALNKNYGEGS